MCLRYDKKRLHSYLRCQSDDEMNGNPPLGGGLDLA